MCELTWHTGCSGDKLTLHVDWFDHDNVPQKTDVVLRILDRDKPRTLAVFVGDEAVWKSESPYPVANLYHWLKEHLPGFWFDVRENGDSLRVSMGPEGQEAVSFYFLIWGWPDTLAVLEENLGAIRKAARYVPGECIHDSPQLRLFRG